MQPKTDRKGTTLIHTHKYDGEYQFGAGTYKNEPRLLIYSTTESRHFNAKTGTAILESLIANGYYIIHNQNPPPPDTEEFLDAPLYEKIWLTRRDIARLKEIREYLKGRLRPTWKDYQPSPTSTEPDS